MVVDLDGDGKKEILTSSFDGKLHCYWLDRTEHGNWPYSVYDPAEGSYPLFFGTGSGRPGRRRQPGSHFYQLAAVLFQQEAAICFILDSQGNAAA